MCTAVLQLLADKVITPYAGAGGTPLLPRRLPAASCLAGWPARHTKAAHHLFTLRMPLLPSRRCPALPPLPNPYPSVNPSQPAGQRFSLDNIVEAIGVATSAARGGKVLLEG